jgi:predicted tellurium resistance membrane protein TerC
MRLPSLAAFCPSAMPLPGSLLLADPLLLFGLPIADVPIVGVEFFSFDWVTNPEAWVALGALTLLEIVLGVDNIVFISILSNDLPEEEQERARRLGLLAALASRVVLLFGISFILRLSAPLFEVLGRTFSGRDLILMVGGVFLIGKATRELHDKLEGSGQHGAQRAASSFASVIVQIFLLDLVFSLDSVLTAVGMADEVMVMVMAVCIAIGFMILAVNRVADFIDRHPTVKILGISFLLLIGFTLVAEGAGQHIPKGYIYAAMGFSLMVEMINLRVARGTSDEADEASEPVKLHHPRLSRAVAEQTDDAPVVKKSA